MPPWGRGRGPAPGAHRTGQRSVASCAHHAVGSGRRGEAARRVPDASLAQAVAVGHGALSLAVVLPLLERLALVVELLASADADLELGAAVEEVQAQRHDRDAALARPDGELVDLRVVQQQLALAARSVVGPRPLGVLGDVDVLRPRLATLDVDVALRDVGAALAQRLHLGAGEDDARLDPV